VRKVEHFPPNSVFRLSEVVDQRTKMLAIFFGQDAVCLFERNNARSHNQQNLSQAVAQTYALEISLSVLSAVEPAVCLARIADL